LIANDKNCIQGHFYDATVSKMAANKIEKLLMVSDFNENWYLRVFWSEELVGNDAICIQGHFYEAIIFQSETIDNLTILLAAILKLVAS
jgi:hypothetical protein